MELIYEWIQESREKYLDGTPVLKDLEINFSNEYNIHFELNNKTLTIDKKTNLQYNPFHKSSTMIESMNCIVGNNGSGKTILLKHLYHVDMLPMEKDNLSSNKTNYTLQIIKFDNKLYLYENLFPIIELKINNPDIFAATYDCEHTSISHKEIFNGGNYSKMTKVFITNDPFAYLNESSADNNIPKKIAFTPYDMDIFNSQLFDCLCLKENGLAYHNDNFYKYNDIVFDHPVTDYSYNLLYLMLLKVADEKHWGNKFNYIKGFKFQVAKKFLFSTRSFQYNCYSYYSSVVCNNYEKKIGFLTLRPQEEDKTKLKNLFHIDYDGGNNKDLFQLSAIYDLCAESETYSDIEIIKDLDHYLRTELLFSIFGEIGDVANKLNKTSCELLDDFNALIQNAEDNRIKDEYNYYYNALEKIKKLDELLKNRTDSFSHNTNDYIVYHTNSIDDNCYPFLKFIEDEIESKQSFLLKYIEFGFPLSAGEKAFLNIFSYILNLSYLKFYLPNLQKNFSDHILLLIDEADLLCHPEWQRKYTKELIEMCEFVFHNKSIHIIITTHSPLLLSDFPNQKIIRMSGNKILDTTTDQTFGANIFDLYKDNFFLDDYIGVFSKDVINGAIKDIYTQFIKKRESQSELLDNDNFDRAKKIVEMIGDPILRNNLKSMISFIKGEINDWNISK